MCKFIEGDFEEIIKCKDDPFYFITKFCMVDANRELVDQLALGENVSKLGETENITRTVLCYILWASIYWQNKTTVMLAPTFEKAKKNLACLMEYHDNLPSYFQHTVLSRLRSSVQFSNGVGIMSRAAHINAVKGMTISTLYVNDYTHLNSMQRDSIDDLMPVLTRFSQVITA